MKKFIAMLLALTMALSMIGTAWAEGTSVAEIGEDKYSSLQEAVAAAQNGDTITLLDDATLETTTTLKAGVTYEIPKELKLIVGEGVTVDAADTATLNCYGTIVVSGGATADISNLVYGEGKTFGNCGGKLTIMNGGLAVLLDSWAGNPVNWTPEKDKQSLGKMLKDCEVGAMVSCGTTTWQQVEKDVWVDMSTFVAKVNGIGYTSLAAAVDAVPADGTATITLLKNTIGAGIKLVDTDNKNITFDFGGYTYTCADPAVGSSGTESQGFHFEKGNTVKMMNGTVDVEDGSEVKLLIQNYCDLTLENMIVDGTNLDLAFYGDPDNPDAGPRYTVSNNCGNVVINNTTIIADDGEIAFDTCQYGSYTAPTVTVTGTSVINGAVEASGGTLTVENGYFSGAISVVAPGEAADISISGGYFTVDPSDYCATGCGVLTSDKDGYDFKVGLVAASVGTVNYATLQEAVDAVENGGTITVAVAGASATVNEAKSFTVTGEAATITAAEGFAVLENNNTYTVLPTYSVSFDANGGSGTLTIDPVPTGTYTLPENPFTAPEGKQFKAWSVNGKEYKVGDKITVAAEVTVVAVWEYLPAVTEDPEVDVIDPVVSTGDKVDTSNETVNNVVTAITTGVEIDHGAITDAAEEAADDNKVVPTKEHAKELNKLPNISGTTVNDVAIVVQTYYDVEIEAVEVENNKTSSITVDITPMQQTVATTETIVDSNADIKVGKNAVKVGDPVPVKIAEPVEITLKLPSSCFEVGQKVYITHKASVGTVIYEATVAADYTITFTTTHGFSPFTISSTPAEVKASVGTDNYADLQSAVNYMGKDATVTVKAPDQEAEVDFATTFTVKYENGATKDNTKIYAASGYYLTAKDVTDGVQYTVSKIYYGGYYTGTTTTETEKDLVTSPDTFDAGIAVSVAVSVLGTTGSAWLLRKKED